LVPYLFLFMLQRIRDWVSLKNDIAITLLALGQTIDYCLNLHQVYILSTNIVNWFYFIDLYAYFMFYINQIKRITLDISKV